MNILLVIVLVIVFLFYINFVSFANFLQNEKFESIRETSRVNCLRRNMSYDLRGEVVKRTDCIQ